MAAASRVSTEALPLGAWVPPGLVAQRVKNQPAMQETWVRSLGGVDPLEKGMATHSSILVWRIPWTEEPDRLLFKQFKRVGHDRWTNTFTCSFYIGLAPPFPSLISLCLFLFVIFNPLYSVLISCFCSVTQSCLTLCDPMDHSTPGFPVLYYLQEPAQTHVCWVSDAMQPSHPPSSSPPAFNLSQHQGLFKWVGNLH